MRYPPYTRPRNPCSVFAQPLRFYRQHGGKHFIPSLCSSIIVSLPCNPYSQLRIPSLRSAKKRNTAARAFTHINNDKYPQLSAQINLFIKFLYSIYLIKTLMTSGTWHHGWQNVAVSIPIPQHSLSSSSSALFQIFTRPRYPLSQAPLFLRKLLGHRIATTANYERFSRSQLRFNRLIALH